MIVIALMAALLGGYWFATLVAAAATAIFYEWTRLTKGWGAGWYVGGFVYALLPALALLQLRETPGDGWELLMWVFIVTWSTDIGGYLVGRSVGGPKLASRISPNKTWAGLYGGMAGAAALGAVWVYVTGLSSALYLLAPAFAVAAQLGDLFESWMKRRSGVKDSGDMLPGHGGVFDRLDGLIPVALLTMTVRFGGLV
jgi:phosphatidate cytidylyltransferase